MLVLKKFYPSSKNENNKCSLHLLETFIAHHLGGKYTDKYSEAFLVLLTSLLDRLFLKRSHNQTGLIFPPPAQTENACTITLWCT